MLLTLMSNLNMFGGVTPVTPTSDSGVLDALPRGGGLYDTRREQEQLGRKKLQEIEEENIIYNMISFILCQ